MHRFLAAKPQDGPGFYFFRVVWVSPTQILESCEKLREKYPDVKWEVVDPYTFFELFKKHHQSTGK